MKPKRNAMSATVRTPVPHLPGKHDNPIIHIRPHATKSAYRLNNGVIRGNVERDANPLPDGQWMTTQSFWINNSYILCLLYTSRCV